MSHAHRKYNGRQRRPQHHNAGHRPASRLGTWRESGDRVLEVFICVGHVVAVVTLVVEHLM